MHLPIPCVSETTGCHDFVGRHLVASYQRCDRRALRSLAGVEDAMRLAVQASGATLLQAARHVFPPFGMTMVLLLSESHASIHTYPEYDACFVDLFTCGDNCDAEAFDAVLRSYLSPRSVTCKVLLRDDNVRVLRQRSGAIPAAIRRSLATPRVKKAEAHT